MKIGYQLYSVRDEAEKDLYTTLCQIKEMGYDGVEFAGFYNYSPEQIKEWLDELNLIPFSSHVSPDELFNSTQQVIETHKKLGINYIAVPWLSEKCRPGGEKFALTLRKLTQMGELLKSNGIQLMYHNHDFEFCRVSGQDGYDFMFDAVPEEYLTAEIDVCWVQVAGYDPVEIISRYAKRCPVIHLKDFTGSKKGNEKLYELIGTAESGEKNETFAFRPLGKGEVDIPAVIVAAYAAGTKICIVEQDSANDCTPMEAAKMSMEYLDTL